MKHRRSCKRQTLPHPKHPPPPTQPRCFGRCPRNFLWTLLAPEHRRHPRGHTEGGLPASPKASASIGRAGVSECLRASPSVSERLRACTHGLLLLRKLLVFVPTDHGEIRALRALRDHSCALFRLSERSSPSALSLPALGLPRSRICIRYPSPIPVDQLSIASPIRPAVCFAPNMKAGDRNSAACCSSRLLPPSHPLALHPFPCTIFYALCKQMITRVRHMRWNALGYTVPFLPLPLLLLLLLLLPLLPLLIRPRLPLPCIGRTRIRR